MCGFQWRIWDRIIIYISVEKSKAQNSSKTHSRPQRSLFLAHLIWTWTCLSSRFHIMQHTSHLPCEPWVSLLYHQRLSGCYRSIRNPLGVSFLCRQVAISCLQATSLIWALPFIIWMWDSETHRTFFWLWNLELRALCNFQSQYLIWKLN